MLKPYTEHAEFIHSFIFRMQDAIGVKDFSNLLSTSGRWKEYIYVHKETQFIYNRHNELDLVQLLRNTGFDKKYNVQQRTAELKKPVKYIEDLHKLLNPKTKPRGLKIPNYVAREVRFCSRCIADMVDQYGTGFFKGEWQISKYCNIHKVPLLQLTSSSKASAVKDIKMLIRGNLPDEFQELVINDEDRQVSPQLYD